MRPGGHGTLGVAGRDTTVGADVVAYPGCAALHRELRGPGGYSTVLTARPPILIRAMVEGRRGEALLREFGPRMALVPGASAPSEIGRNLKNILVARLSAIRAAVGDGSRRRRGATRGYSEGPVAAPPRP